jgi:hypothetical protein
MFPSWSGLLSDGSSYLRHFYQTGQDSGMVVLRSRDYSAT